MSCLQHVVSTSVAEGDLPFVVAMVGGSRGGHFSGAAGKATATDDAGEDTLFRLFSMSKAVCATAAMVLIDRGKLDIDTPVQEILPDFGLLRVLDGFDGDIPRLRVPRTEATVRHLATHTVGLAYEPWDARITRYMELTGHPSIITGKKAALFYPMSADPGTRWSYGQGVEWLGLLVEAVSGRNIVRFCQEEIFDPLGMSSTCFEVPSDSVQRLSSVFIRNEQGTFDAIDIGPPTEPETYYMGHSLYGTPSDYLRFLRMFLNRGELDGRRILSDQAVEFMLSDHARGLKFEKMISCSSLSADVNPFPGSQMTHSLGFLMNEDDIPGMRRQGSQGWAGLLNSHYWVDPKSDLAGVFMTQSLPFCEPRFIKRFREFERAVYATMT